MADPVIPGGIRAQLVLSGKTGLPEDTFVTTWAFKTASGSVDGAHRQQVASMLENWLTGVGANGNSIVNMLGEQVLGGVGAGRVKTYDLGGLPPRNPTTFTFDVPAPAPSTSMPAEVAITCSFRGSVSTPRTRGRVYVGPLAGTSTVKTSDGATGRQFVSSVARLTIVQACQRLRAYPRPEFPTWCILSQRNLNLVEVEGGWVDDAFDTQRRRGLDPVGRTTWVPS
jgi:hypothetical protein